MAATKELWSNLMLGDFSQQADAYRRARPTYPVALIELLVKDAGVVPGDAVAEFGAGTGIFTRLLVERGLRVTALEPNDVMRSHHDVQHAVWTAGTFENSGLPDASQCWAVAAQAFHWAEPSRALPEIRRILEPGGVLTVLWNNRNVRDSELVRASEAIIHRHVPEFDEAYRQRRWDEVLASTGDFTFLNHRAAKHVVPMSKLRYMQLWKSHNRLTTIAGPARFAVLLREIDDYLNGLGLEEVDVPYECEAWSARANVSGASF